MTARPPLPARILIPVANPSTAEELIRLGADLLDARTGELTALGIVEVPEGMPLSEGATRARHARRLLQRVLDFVPEGTTIHPIVRIGRHAAEGIIEAAAEQEADLIIFGWGGKAPAGRDGRTVRRSRRRSTRSSATRPPTSRSSSSAARRELKRILVPVRGGPHAELALRFADAIARRHDGEVVVLHFVPPGITLAVRAQAERALAAFVRQHVSGQGRGASSARRRTSATRSCARPTRPISSSWARRPRRRGRRRRRAPLRRAARGDRRPRQADGRRRQDPRDDRPRRRSSSSPRGPRPSPPPTAPPRRRAPCRPASSAGSASRTSTTPSSPTCAGSSSSRRSRA